MPSNVKEPNDVHKLTSERILFPDILRIAAVFAVMMLHVCGSVFCSNSVESYNWQVVNFYESFLRWAVPAFVMISGMFFLNPKKDLNLSKLYHKNIFRIVTALVFWGILYRTISVFEIVDIDKINFKSLAMTMLNEYSKLLFGPVWYHLWFLYMIIGLYIMVPLFRVFTRHAKEKHYKYLILVYLLLGSVLPLIKDSLLLVNRTLEINFEIAEMLGFSCYFIMGYYLFKYKVYKRTKRWIYALAIISVVFQIAGTFYVSNQLGTGHELLYETFRPNIVLQSVAVFLFVKDIPLKVQFSERAKFWIWTLSRYSFGMYLVHDLFNILFSKIGWTATCFNSFFSIPLRSVATFVLSFMVVWVLDRIPVVQKYCM